jgi:Cu2+-exporting ATPase
MSEHSSHATPSGEHPAHVHAPAHGSHNAHAGHEQIFRRRFWACLLLSLPVLVYSPMLQDLLGFNAPAFPGSQWVPLLFSTIIFVYGGLPFLQMALPELGARQPGMMTLISLAISVAFFYSLFVRLAGMHMDFFWELVSLIDIMLLGHWIEMRSVRQASGALGELARLMPDTAERLDDDGSPQVVPLSQVQPGDRVLIRPGASVPADGQVLEGESAVNEAMITGESRPVEKKPGDRVVAGTINGAGSLRVAVAATGEHTTLAGIMRLVQEAQQSKSRTQVLADRAAGWLFYAALGAAALTLVGWTLATGFDITVLERVVTVLVIACPHALGLAIPLVVAITTTLGARHGILIRDRLALENARHIDTVIFDKTGTLTRGEHGVVDLLAAEGMAVDQALAWAAAIEADSEHPMARALRDSAGQKGLSLPAIRQFQALKGRGVSAEIEGHTAYVGGPHLLEALNVELQDRFENFTRTAGEKGQTVVYLVVQERVAAAFALADVVRPESQAAVQALHAMGIQVAMLTGDSEAVARTVARELDVDRYFAQVLPENKDRQVAQLQQQGHKVAMVGDGVNDAPALVRADIGIAIGSGTDVAIQSAGIILVRSNPLDVVQVLQLSRASYRKMIQNLVWAAGYNVVALPLAAGVLAPLGILLSPAAGAGLMSLSTVIVALNAQLLRGVQLGSGNQEA